MSAEQERFIDVTNRLKAALFLDTDQALAERLGLTRTAFAERKRRGALPEPEVRKLCVEAQLYEEWVFTGHGEMRPGMDSALRPLREASDIVRPLTLDPEHARALAELLQASLAGDRGRAIPLVRKLQYVTVPRLDVSAAAGDGFVVWGQNDQVVDALAFRPEWLREIGVNPSRLAVISVRGDSMEDTLRDGDLILVDTMPVERKVPGVYVILRADSLLVKRLNFKTNGSVEIRSDNKAYPTETLSGAEFDQLKLVGRMVRRVVR